MAAAGKSSTTGGKALLFKFKENTVTTVSRETLSEVARTLGFNETQTLHFAVARLRDEVLGGAQGVSRDTDREEPYPRLTAAQLLDVRSGAPRPRGKLVRRQSLL